jgi:hypothetical protein
MRTSRSALVFAGLTALAAAALLPLSAAAHDFVGNGVVTVGVVLPFAIVGAVVARRQPSNPIGWFLVAIAFLFMACTAGGEYAVYADAGAPDRLPLARLGVFVAPLGWLMLLLFLPLPIALFPDGRPLSRRWGWVLAGYLSVWTVVLVSSVVVDSATFTDAHPRIERSGGSLVAMSEPHGWYGELLTVASLLYAVFTGLFVLSQVLAFRRSDGERRQQLKWLLAGGAVSVAGLTFVITLGSSTSHVAQLVSIAGFFTAMALPVGMGVGILKYRLYDIDRLISRTLSYTIVTGLLAAFFLSVVVVTTQVLPFSSPVGVAASTLASAALFNPLRRGVQSRVDRRFNRARYDSEAIVAAFSSRLRSALDVESVHTELLGAVDRAVQPAHASVWVKAI